MANKIIVGLILAQIWSIFFVGLHVIHCCKLSLYAISRKSNESNLKKWQKTSFEHNFGTFGPNLGPQNFFHGLYFYYILGTIASYHCIQFQGKLMNQI